MYSKLCSFLILISFCSALQAQPEVISKDKVKNVFKNLETDVKTGNLITSSEKTIPDMDSDESTTLPAQTQLTEFYGKQIHSDGQQYLITLWNAEDTNNTAPYNGAAILAVFSAQTEEPLDILNVKTDILVSLSEQPSPVLGKNETFVINNNHFNSNENYLDSSLFQLYRGKLQKIDSIFTFSARGLCDSFTEKLSWKTTKSSSPHPPLTANVVLEKKSESNDESCPKKKTSSRRVFSKTYHWDTNKQRYEGNNKEFEQLQQFNEQNL